MSCHPWLFRTTLFFFLILSISLTSCTAAPIILNTVPTNADDVQPWTLVEGVINCNELDNKYTDGDQLSFTLTSPTPDIDLAHYLTPITFYLNFYINETIFSPNYQGDFIDLNSSVITTGFGKVDCDVTPHLFFFLQIHYSIIRHDIIKDNVLIDLDVKWDPIQAHVEAIHEVVPIHIVTSGINTVSNYTSHIHLVTNIDPVAVDYNVGQNDMNNGGQNYINQTINSKNDKITNQNQTVNSKSDKITNQTQNDFIMSGLISNLSKPINQIIIRNLGSLSTIPIQDTENSNNIYCNINGILMNITITTNLWGYNDFILTIPTRIKPNQYNNTFNHHNNDDNSNKKNNPYHEFIYNDDNYEIFFLPNENLSFECNLGHFFLDEKKKLPVAIAFTLIDTTHLIHNDNIHYNQKDSLFNNKWKSYYDTASTLTFTKRQHNLKTTTILPQNFDHFKQLTLPRLFYQQKQQKDKNIKLDGNDDNVSHIVSIDNQILNHQQHNHNKNNHNQHNHPHIISNFTIMNYNDEKTIPMSTTRFLRHLLVPNSQNDIIPSNSNAKDSLSNEFISYFQYSYILTGELTQYSRTNEHFNFELHNLPFNSKIIELKYVLYGYDIDTTPSSTDILYKHRNIIGVGNVKGANIKNNHQKDSYESSHGHDHDHQYKTSSLYVKKFLPSILPERRMANFTDHRHGELQFIIMLRHNDLTINDLDHYPELYPHARNIRNNDILSVVYDHDGNKINDILDNNDNTNNHKATNNDNDHHNNNTNNNNNDNDHNNSNNNNKPISKNHPQSPSSQKIHNSNDPTAPVQIIEPTTDPIQIIEPISYLDHFQWANHTRRDDKRPVLDNNVNVRFSYHNIRSYSLFHTVDSFQARPSRHPVPINETNSISDDYYRDNNDGLMVDDINFDDESVHSQRLMKQVDVLAQRYYGIDITFSDITTPTPIQHFYLHLPTAQYNFVGNYTTCQLNDMKINVVPLLINDKPYKEHDVYTTSTLFVSGHSIFPQQTYKLTCHESIFLKPAVPLGIHDKLTNNNVPMLITTQNPLFSHGDSIAPSVPLYVSMTFITFTDFMEPAIYMQIIGFTTIVLIGIVILLIAYFGTRCFCQIVPDNIDIPDPIILEPESKPGKSPQRHGPDDSVSINDSDYHSHDDIVFTSESRGNYSRLD